MDQRSSAVILQKYWRRYMIRKRYLVNKQYEETLFALFYLEKMKQLYNVDIETIESLKRYNKDLERFLRTIRIKYDINTENNLVGSYGLPNINDPEE